MEVWGNAYTTNVNYTQNTHNTQEQYELQIEGNIQTNRLFIKSWTIKLQDYVQFQMLLIMFKAKNRLLSESLQKLFVLRLADDDHRRTFHFKTWFAQTTLK